jgi:hypothetical protein
VWTRTVDGRILRFSLAGINNQNFLMRDDQTGSWWQQANGKAIYGAFKGKSLDLVPYDELSYGLWKEENPDGLVLAPSVKDAHLYEADWEPEVQRLPTVISFPGTPLASRDVVMGIEFQGASRAYPVDAILGQSPIEDRLGGEPILLLAGPDRKSIRAFISEIDGTELEFFRKLEGDWSLTDSTYASEWNFKGCAITGPAEGKCLKQIPLLKDYWFDWRNYHPKTSIYHH